MRDFRSIQLQQSEFAGLGLGTPEGRQAIGPGIEGKLMNEEETVWPNFFIVGAPRCGTTSLYSYLSQHPQVFFPVLKEPHYFALTPLPANLDENEKWFYRCCGNQEEYNHLYQPGRGYAAIGDASPSYLWDRNAAERIHAACPDAKIVVILRDPILRAHSNFTAIYSTVENGPTFMEELERELAMNERTWWNSHLHVDIGLYCDQIRRYFDLFGRENVLVLLTDDLNKRPREVLSQLTEHLGIDPFPGEMAFAETVHNQFREPRAKGLFRIAKSLASYKLREALLPESMNNWLRRSSLLYSNDKPKLEDEPRRLLQEIFEPEMRRVEELLGRELPQLRKSWA